MKRLLKHNLKCTLKTFFFIAIIFSASASRTVWRDYFWLYTCSRWCDEKFSPVTDFTNDCDVDLALGSCSSSLGRFYPGAAIQSHLLCQYTLLGYENFSWGKSCIHVSLLNTTLDPHSALLSQVLMDSHSWSRRLQIKVHLSSWQMIFLQRWLNNIHY